MQRYKKVYTIQKNRVISLSALLRDIYQMLSVGVENARLGDKSKVASLLVDNRQHPGMVLLKFGEDTLNLLMLHNAVWGLNHVADNRRAILLALEHILTQIVELNYA